MIHIIYYNYSYTRYILNVFQDNNEISLLQVNRETWLEEKLIAINKYLNKSIYIPAYFNKELSKFISHIKEDDTLILFDYLKYDNVKYILAHTNCHNIHLWFWNTINATTKRLLPLKIQSNLKFHTFDPDDSKKYDLILHNQVYRIDRNINSQDICSIDFFFIGLNKNRYNLLYKLNQKLREWGYTTKIVILDKSIRPFEDNGIEVINKEIDYEIILEFISDSKVLIDLTKEGQKGPTLRCLEGLFLNKKIVTNNNIRTLPFYNENNFLLLSENLSKDQLKSFMSKEYSPCAESLKNSYNIETWLSEIEKTNHRM